MGYSHCGKQCGCFSKNLRIELSSNLAIPLLGIYPKEMISLCERDIYTPMFVAALFIYNS